MEILIGLLIIAVGSFGQSSSYVPIRKVRDWSWESFWLVQGIFAWIVFPWLGASLALPEGVTLGALWAAGGAWQSVFYGVLWGVGGLTFGLSMRYLGVALGQSIALGTCAAFGTLFPALLAGQNLFRGEGLALLLGVCITLAGIAVIGYAGSLRSRLLSDEERRAAVKDFALTKGLLVALLAGAMSACFSLGLESGAAIQAAAVAAGVKELFALNPVILLVTLGGFATNAAYCIFCNVKNRTGRDYFSVPAGVWVNNVLFCALAGVLWYSQFFGLGMGKSFFAEAPLMLAFSWSILMSLNVLFSNLWGILLHEWRGVDRRTAVDAAPLVQQDAPQIAEQHVERHEDAPREGQHQRRLCEEALAHAQPEELRVPQHAGQRAEEHVVDPHARRYREVVAARAVFHVAEDAVGGIGRETAERHEQNHRIQREKLLHAGCDGRRLNGRAAFEAQTETGAHRTGQQRHQQPLGQREILHRRTALLVAEQTRTQRTGIADHGDARQRDADAQQQRQPLAAEEILPRQQRGEERAERCAGTQCDRLSERHAQIAHRQAEGQSPDTPQHAVEDRLPGAARRPQRTERHPFGQRQTRTQPREDDPCEDALHQPEALPRPVAHLADRHVGARLSEAPDGDNQQSDQNFHVNRRYGTTARSPRRTSDGDCRPCRRR